jgi:hypothetical protein
MEKGLKNIQAAYKSAQRKERGMAEHDSGFGCSDAECEIDMDPTVESSQTAAQREQPGDELAFPGRKMSIQAMLSPSPSHSN